MKRIIIGLALFALLAPVAQAGTWKSPHYPYGDLTLGNCALVNTQSEANATHVYTLNPDNTIAINSAYMSRWDRNARCDEIQFHVDHNTSINRLTNWLDETAYGWYANIGTSHFKNQTISTSRHEWFFVDVNGIHRIPDWLTALSRGLLINDRISIPPAHTEKFYELAEIGPPLLFSSIEKGQTQWLGPWSEKVYNIWKNGDRDYTTGHPPMPSRLVEELGRRTDCASFAGSCSILFESCQYIPYTPPDEYENLLDWSWMLRNPGCPLAD